ncbi:MAG: RES family NAD+ phosphorylase [Deltaproteobacteria bacterium]|nr:RES family NAD+ phosphorylase [Deltaproteobacteria bacterium]
MRLWRLSNAEDAHRFDGGYGLYHDGRWNTRGHLVTYCATGPALCVLEKLVHVEDPALLPDGTTLVCYEVPDELATDEVRTDQLPVNWRSNQPATQRIGDEWLHGAGGCLLRVPSVIVPIAESGDRNFLINHRHEAVTRIYISYTRMFEYDPRLFTFG